MEYSMRKLEEADRCSFCDALATLMIEKNGVSLKLCNVCGDELLSCIIKAKADALAARGVDR